MAIIILHDITELQQQTEHKIENERLNAITMLAAGVAHEIGNPLNTLTIHLQLLNRYFNNIEKNEESSDAHEMVEIALDEVNRLDQIINTFLKALRPVSLELEDVSLKVIVEESLRKMKQEFENKKIHIECEWPNKLPSILADYNQLIQVLYNIYKNALQAMGDGGLLTINIEDKEEAIQIRDTLKAFYTVIKSMDAYVRFVFITGRYLDQCCHHNLIGTGVYRPGGDAGPMLRCGQAYSQRTCSIPCTLTSK